MSKRTIPAISIVIPMYNAEKYVGECLDSILAQTFDDYEVIVVDDCSTDGSAAIVESYIPKFTKGGVERLQLIRSKVNSGGAGTPRNIGLKVSLGDYIFFMDSDDALMPYALEKLISVAEKFSADVVNCEKFYRAPGDTVTTDKNLLQEIDIFGTVANSSSSSVVVSKDLTERVNRLVNGQIRWEPWRHFIRREILMENNLNFSKLSVADDLLFSICLVLVAEKMAFFSEGLYVFRTLPNSNSRQSLPPDKRIHRRAGDFLRAIGILDKFMDKFEMFTNNKKNKFAVFDFFARAGGLLETLELYMQIPAAQLDDLIRRELGQIEDLTPLTAFILARMNIFNVNIIQQRQLIQKQQQQIQQLQAQLQQLQQSQPQQTFHLNTEDIFK